VWTIPEVVEHPQLRERPVLQTVETEHGALRLVGSGFRLEHGGGSIETPPRLPGADTDAVLGEAGYSAEEIAAFKKGGAASEGIRAGAGRRK
jgi:crotonobetainyl-CoA:carnitine CoA-transferase CaiB-like acyl-CoA transferase